MSFLLEAIKGMTPAQQEAVLKLDPVPRAHGTSGAFTHLTSLAHLTAIEGLTPDQVTGLLVAFANDLFDAQMGISAYIHLLVADERDGGRRTVDRAIERSELVKLYRNLGAVSIVKEDWRRAFEVAVAHGRFDDAFSFIYLPMRTRRIEAAPLRRMLRAAVERGDLQTARRCLAYLKRGFTRVEARALTRWILYTGWGGLKLNEEEFDFIGSHASKRLRRMYFLNVCKYGRADWDKLLDLAERFGSAISPKHLKAIVDNNKLKVETRIAAMERLVAMVPTSQHKLRLRMLYRKARSHAMMGSAIVEAEAYGAKVGKPLTCAELLAFIREWSVSTAGNAHHYKRLLPWARELLLARLQDPSALSSCAAS